MKWSSGEHSGHNVVTSSSRIGSLGAETGLTFGLAFEVSACGSGRVVFVWGFLVGGSVISSSSSKSLMGGVIVGVRCKLIGCGSKRGEGSVMVLVGGVWRLLFFLTKAIFSVRPTSTTVMAVGGGIGTTEIGCTIIGDSISWFGSEDISVVIVSGVRSVWVEPMDNSLMGMVYSSGSSSVIGRAMGSVRRGCGRISSFKDSGLNINTAHV